jgi:hypothetical protein
LTPIPLGVFPIRKDHSVDDVEGVFYPALVVLIPEGLVADDQGSSPTVKAL